MSAFRTIPLAPKGSTGNGSFAIGGMDSAAAVCLEFQVEAVGATPTITYKLQGSVNVRPDDPNPPTEFFEDLELVFTDTATTHVKTDTKTATGTFVYWVEGLLPRAFRRYQLVTSANTNVTYSARLHVLER
jgi:hypothetical protein